MTVKKRAKLSPTERRLRALERDSHEPFDFGWLIQKVNRLENEVADLKRIASEKKRGRKGS